MPGIIIFNRRWSFGSDDLVVPGAFFAVLHMTWTVILGVIYGTVSFENSSGDQLCLTSLRQHVLGNIIIMSCCVLCEASIAHLAMRGTILHTHPRRGMKYLIYIRLGIFIVEHIWLVVGIVWISQYYTECQAPTPKKALLGIVVCNAVIMISVLLSMWCTFDGAGRSWVKLKRYQEGLKDKEKIPGHKRRSGSRRRNWRHSLIVSSKEYRKAIQMYERSWDKRCRTLFCCVGRDRHQGSFSEVARLFTEFFRDLDVVPSDIVAGLVLLRKQQKTRRREIVEQHTNEVYQFLSGVPISPSTRFLRLKNPSELAECQRVIHYMRYALAAYGWPMYMMTHAGTGICRIMPSLSCCCGGCCCCHEQKERVELDADNCCDCNLAALYKLLKLSKQDCSVIYCTYHCDIGETPFFVALDHVHRRVVVAIRGTTSLQDVLTDLKAEPEPLPVEPIREDWLAHKGMVQAAVYIKKQLRERQLLQAAFSQDIDRGTHDYDLAIVGHSLGAGTAAILAILLQQEHPGLHCYAFSPPGGLLSAPCVEHTKSFITSVVVGKDVVPRIGLYQLETLRQDLINVIKKSEKQKWRIIGGSLCCCCKERDTQPEPVTPEGVAMFDEVRAKRETRYFTHPTDSAIALTSHIPLYPPGNIIHVVRTHPQKTKTCSSEEPIYQAVWASNMDLDEVLISPTMVNDHMPETVLEALNKVLPTVHSIVSPGLNSTHGETSLLLPPASSPIDRLNSPEFQQAQISPIQDERRPLYDDISRPIETIIDVERLIGDNVGQNYSSKCSCNIQMEHQQSNCSVRLSSQSSLNDYVRHSPESTNQITYSWIDGAYSPAGRGYPHGTGIDPSSLNGQCVRTKLPDRGSKSSNSEQSFSPEELRALLSDENYRCDDRDLTSPELQEKDLQRRDSGICTCQCNAPTSSTANTPSHDQKPSLCIVSDFDNNKQDAATKTPFCTCTNLTKHQLNGPLVEEKVTITVNGIAKSLSDELPSEMPCLQITADVTTQPHNVFIKSEELRDPMLTSPDDEEYMRDDVSCSDSEPFMPHQVDSDGQTSPMDATLHLERFIQESRV